MTHHSYEQWLAERRSVSPPSTLANEIMSQVAELERQRRALWWMCMVQRIEQSRAACLAVCSGALAVGCLPFIFLARFAQLVSF
jgi:hypothetical protein